MAPGVSANVRGKLAIETRPPSNQDSTSPEARRPSYRARVVTASDDDLIGIAASTKDATEWENVLLSARAGPGRWRMEHAAGDFTVYTRHEAHRFGVLAIGLVSGSAGEIMNVLQCQNSAQYAQQMAAVFETQFKEGSFVYHIPHPRRDRLLDKQVQLVDLSVKTVTFQKAGWLGTHEEWCYLDAVYRHGNTGAAEKLMTTLDPTTLAAGLSARRTKSLHGVMCAYLLLPETPDASNQDDHDDGAKKTPVKRTRVHFFGEYVIPKHFGFNVASLSPTASDKLIKQRLVRLADSCARLSLLVRRQRLGVQDVVDYTRILPPTNTPCVVCTKMLVVAKICRLCGMGVCTDCSQKHERATLPSGRGALHVETIRVCATCLYRVDRATYDNLTPASLRGPHIVPDSIDTASPTAALRELLHDALVKAPSPSRKAGVMNVIKCVLDQQAAELSSSASSSSSASRLDSLPSSAQLLTPTSSEQEYLDALEYLDVEHLKDEQATCRTHEERCYRVDASDPDAALNAPLSEEEEARLRAVEKIDMNELAESVELNLLCHMAAKEMNCSTSTISIFDRENLNCIAANIEAYERLKLPRWNTMCAHTILDKRPHLIPHPESDIRMADALVVTGYGVRFYFAFPVVDVSDQIIGSYCVMNEETREITASQYSAFKKLSETCNKVVRLHAETRRRRKSSSFSTTSSACSNNAHY